jgi:hypothetical protein
MLLPAQTSAVLQITTCGYERIKFELIYIGLKGKHAVLFFKLSTSTVTSGARVGRPDHDRSIVLDDWGRSHVWRR